MEQTALDEALGDADGVFGFEPGAVGEFVQVYAFSFAESFGGGAGEDDRHAGIDEGHPVGTEGHAEFAAAGDLVLAAESAKFTMAYTGIGVSPDGSSSYFLPRLIGMRRTQELMLTNRRLSASEAQAWGLVTEVVPVDETTLPIEILQRAEEIFLTSTTRDVQGLTRVDDRALEVGPVTRAAADAFAALVATDLDP